MKNIKTSTRNVKQSIRKFDDNQRREIIRQIDNRPSTISKSEMFEKFNLGGGNLYYKWKEKMGMSQIVKRVNKVENVKMTKPMFVKTSGKQLHTVTLSVEVGSIMDLIHFCTEITKTPKVKSVLSVE